MGDGCDTLGTRLKYVEGHFHCNKIILDNTGFMLGSFGMTNCGGDFGVPILDTRNGTAKLHYFELGKQGQRTENFDVIIDCFRSKGYSRCLNYAQVWMEETLPVQLESSPVVSAAALARACSNSFLRR